MDRVFHVKQSTLSQFVTVAIDGPTGVGKSTIARRLAEQWGLLYVDTGAMFRCLALKWKALGSPEEEEILRQIGDSTHIVFTAAGKIFCDEKDVSAEIRTEEISKLASKISRFGAIREVMKQQQRQLVAKTEKQCLYAGAVLEGRDIGTVVCPNAEVKIFITEALKLRDQQDRNRVIAPLNPADDAVLVDTTQLTPEQVLGQMSDHINHTAHQE